MKEDKKRKLKEIHEKYSKIRPKGPKSCISRVQSGPRWDLKGVLTKEIAPTEIGQK